jgi:cytochrome c-type biogenesis protein CcsB
MISVNGRRVWLLAVLLACVAGWGSPAWAQTAPAGNQVEPEDLRSPGRGVSEPVNPWRSPPAPSAMSIEEKEAFSRRVDLRAVRGLAVYHNGRVKVLDSLAREVIATIADRKDYVDLAPSAGGRVRKVAYDPVFTYLDLIFDPGYYDDKPLIATNLSVREAILERVFPGPENAERAETYKRLGRIKPLWARAHAPALFGAGAQSDVYRRGLDELERGMGLARNVIRTMNIIPADRVDRAWSNVADLDVSDLAQARVAALMIELGEAWRRGDSERVNSALSALAAQVPSLAPNTYPGARRTAELLYNRLRPFDWGAWLYAMSFVSLLLAFGTGRPWLRTTGLALLAAAIAVHAAGFAARCYIAERYSIQNQFESMTGVSLFAALVGLGLLLRKKQLIFAAAAAGAGFLVLITATMTGIPGKEINREAAILNTSVLLKYHVTTVLFSYGLITLGFIISLFYLGTYYRHRLPGAAVVESTAPVSAQALGLPPEEAAGSRVLTDLDRAQNTVLQLAFWTLGVGILLGAWWADHSWGRWWAFDPKELWALVTWVVYLVVVHVRVAGVKNRGLVTAWLSVAGFAAMLWCYFGVNLLLPGLHAYA